MAALSGAVGVKVSIPRSLEQAAVQGTVGPVTSPSCSETYVSYSATVTLDDSLGVVRYDPWQVNPAQIAAHLTKLTGFGATILPGL